MGRRRIMEGSGNDRVVLLVVPLVEAVLARGIVRWCVFGSPAVGAARLIVGGGVRCHALGFPLIREL